MVCCLGLELHAADKSGVSPNTISLPKGPGAIEGLGESFQPTLNTGTAKYGIGLKLPAGTAGQQPSLALVYESGNANGPLGFGWNLPIPFIQRQSDRGIPTYGENVGFDRADTFITDSKEELVGLSNGWHFCKNEGSFVRYRREGDAWIGDTPDGNRLYFGVTAGGRIQDGTNRVFCWKLERTTDTHGNTVLYTYTNFPGVQNTNQQYLVEIRHGPGAPPWENFHFARLNYENRPDWFEDCRPGFAVRTGQRLKTVVIGTQGPLLAGHQQGDFNQDGLADNLVRRYELEYLDYAGSNSHWSLLASVRLVGADGVTALPPATFGCNVSDPPDQLSATGRAIAGVNEPPLVMDSAYVDFADVNADGLPDVLRTGGPEHFAFVNRGEKRANGARVIQWEGPLGMDAETGGAWNYSLNADSTHLADMDGDGLADLVHKSAAETVFYFANRGTLLWGESRLMSTEAFTPPAPFGVPDVRTADVDFDKRMDLIRGDGLQYQVWFNFGQDRYSERITIPHVAAFDFAQPTVQIADFNGDRLPDITQVRPTGLDISAGLGYGRFAERVFVPLPDDTLDDSQVQTAKLMDINGDGLADLVIERAAPGELWYWLNRANYTLNPRKTITGMPTGVGLNAAIRWADINGNGSTDLVYADTTGEPRLQAVDLGELLGCLPSPNTLRAISNGIGRVTLIGYEPSTKFALEDADAGRPWPDPVPFPVSVVSAVTNLDSLGHTYLALFRYHDGYYDPTEKQFRGFARVEQVDVGDPTAPTLVARSHFDTGRDFEAMKGKVLALTTETETGAVFSTTTNYWTLPPVSLYTGTNGTNVTFVHPTGTVTVISELGQGTPRRLESESAYDRYGNQTTNANYGIVENGERSAFNDERITVTEYALNTNAWLLRFPARQLIMDENGAVISQTESYYDDETFAGNNLGNVTLGNLTMRREWIDPSSPTAFVKSARTQYDTYGNPITLLDPLGFVSGGTPDFAAGHARQLVYDVRFHAYPITEVVHVGGGSDPLIFQANYDEGFGTVTTSTDFNTNVTTYSYDALARLTSIVKPGDSLAYPTVEYDYVLALPVGGTGLVNYVETRQLDSSEIRNPKSDMYFHSRQFVDGLGRTLMNKAEAEPETEGGSPRVTVKGATLFNARQKPRAVVNPFYTTLSGDLLAQLGFEYVEAPTWTGRFHENGLLVTLSLTNAHKTSTAYDATLRESVTTNPDGSFRRTAYEPLLTKSYDENDTDPASPYYDTPTLHYNDGLGRLIRVEEITRLNDDGTPSASLKTWPTRYEYDLNDQLTRITDSQNNVKWFEYDGLRRKTFMNDPNRGILHWVYDEASNLIETTDAKNQRITYTYDGVNRLLTEKYHDGRPLPPWRGSTLNPQLSTNFSVIYHYDTPFPNLPQGDNTTATARNTKGMLAWVEDLSGEEHISYDARSRNEWLVKRVPDPVFLSTLNSQPTTLVSYRTAFDYDSADRVTRVVYPDNDEMAYRYNARSLVHQIVGGANGLTRDGLVIRDIRYHPSDQQVEINYGNGVRTTYHYDSRIRLKNLLTVSQPATLNQSLINFQYDFDGVSNIRTIEDRRPGSAVPEGDPRRNTQLFQYDDLYRLTRVQYCFELPGQTARNDGEINYRYDRIGNMLAQTSTLTNHLEKGLPVADLGEMDSGGSPGRWNRNGRSVGDPPGPHALTSIRHSEFGVRNYQYDSNGNMLTVDGLTNTWDFKDRLVAVENSEMRAEYTYDYSDRRILKHVIYNQDSTNRESRVTVTYVNKYFEVRERDAPTKYIWDGATRVARVTGSLSTNLRVQRLRLYPGWNLCSLAVSPPTPLWGEGRGEVLSAAFRWNPATLGWDEVLPSDTLPAGTVLWLRAITNATLAITGIYTEPTSRAGNALGDFLAGAGLEAWNLQSASSNLQFACAWFYDPAIARWLSSLPPLLSLQSGLPRFIAPGETLFIHADAPVQLPVPETVRRISYYHQDHLRSSSSLSDQQGLTVQAMALFPFGELRHFSVLASHGEPHHFAQKERDKETGLSDFGARYCATALGRFWSVDPLLPRDTSRNPQDSHPYAYAGNRPLVAVDVGGLAPCPAEIAEGIESSSTFQAVMNPPVPPLLKSILKVAYAPVVMPFESTAATVSTVLNVMKLGTGVAEATQAEGMDKVVPILQDVQRFSEGFTTLGGVAAPLAAAKVPQPPRVTQPPRPATAQGPSLRPHPKAAEARNALDKLWKDMARREAEAKGYSDWTPLSEIPGGVNYTPGPEMLKVHGVGIKGGSTGSIDKIVNVFSSAMSEHLGIFVRY